VLLVGTILDQHKRGNIVYMRQPYNNLLLLYNWTIQTCITHIMITTNLGKPSYALTLLFNHMLVFCTWKRLFS